MLARLPFPLATLLLAVACSPSYRLTNHSDPSMRTHRERIWASHFVLGFVGSKELDLRDHCRGGEAVEVSQKVDLLPLLIWCATFGIYAPARIVVTCSESPSPRRVGDRAGGGFVSTSGGRPRAPAERRSLQPSSRGTDARLRREVPSTSNATRANPQVRDSSPSPGSAISSLPPADATAPQSIQVGTHVDVETGGYTGMRGKP